MNTVASSAARGALAATASAIAIPLVLRLRSSDGPDPAAAPSGRRHPSSAVRCETGNGPDGDAAADDDGLMAREFGSDWADAKEKVALAKKSIGPDRYRDLYQNHPCGDEQRAWHGCLFVQAKLRRSDPSVDPKAMCLDPLHLRVLECMERTKDQREQTRRDVAESLGPEQFEKMKVKQQEISERLLGADRIGRRVEMMARMKEEVAEAKRRREKGGGDGDVVKVEVGREEEMHVSSSSDGNTGAAGTSNEKKSWWRFGF